MPMVVQSAASMDGSQVLDIGGSLFVCLMGVGIVFLGLVCIVLICWIMSLFFKNGNSDTPVQNAPVSAPVASPVVSAGADIPESKRGEFIAAISAAIAEDMGTDVSGIRITSVKKL